MPHKKTIHAVVPTTILKKFTNTPAANRATMIIRNMTIRMNRPMLIAMTIVAVPGMVINPRMLTVTTTLMRTAVAAVMTTLKQRQLTSPSLVRLPIPAPSTAS